MKRLLRLAGDYGDANIPSPFITQALAGIQNVQLYWRELAYENKTIEIWSTSDDTFVILEGDFSDGEWGSQDVQLVSEQLSLDNALSFVYSNYVIKEDVVQFANKTRNYIFKTSRLRKNK